MISNNFDITKDPILVTVVIPVFNTEKYIRTCLDSIQNQTLEAIQVICVDNESTDKSLEIIQEYSKLDSRFLPLRQKQLKEPNISLARNVGLKLAYGEYLFFLDSDDYLEPTALEFLYRTAVEQKSDVVIGKSHLFDDVSQTIFEVYNQKDYTLSCLAEEDFHKSCTFSEKSKKLMTLPQVLWNSLFKRNFLEKNQISFDPEQWYYSERPFYLQSILLAEHISFLAEIVVYHRLNRMDSLSSNYDKSFLSRLLVWKRVEELVKKRNIYEESSIILDEITEIYQLYIKIKRSNEEAQIACRGFVSENISPSSSLLDRCTVYLSCEEKDLQRMGHQILYLMFALIYESY